MNHLAVDDAREATLDPVLPDPSLDRYARMVQRTLDVPVALVSIVEETRQVFPGAVGLAAPWSEERQTPLSHSFCKYVVADSAPLVVEDARDDERLRDNLAIPDLGVVAYLGWPVVDAKGEVIGSLCAIDSEPRAWSQADLDALEDLAASCSTELGQRQLRTVATERATQARRAARRNRVLLSLSEGLSETRRLDEVAEAVARVAVEGLGCMRAGLWVRELRDPAAVPVLRDRGPTEAETIVFVAHGRRDWESVERNQRVEVSSGNPLGSAMLLREPVYFSDLAGLNSAYPKLAHPDQIGAARAVVPLVTQDDVYGVLALVWAEPREFSDTDRAMIGALAAYTTQALQRALLFEERVDVSLKLQNAMLTRLPHFAGLELAARYRPAAVRERVGGDWYDALPKTNADLDLVIGDVVGHDMAAAATMGQLRNMLRALAWAQEESPAGTVTRLDQAAGDLDVDGLATLIYARVVATDGGHELQWTNAGHLPPILLAPDGSATVLEGADDGDVMLGVEPARPRRDHIVPLPPGSTVVMMTDGLVERRDESIDVGVERARRSLAGHAGEPLEQLLDTLIVETIGDHLDDDLAVLAVRTPPPSGA